MKNTKKNIITMLISTIVALCVLVSMFTLLQPPVAKAAPHRHVYYPTQILLPNCIKSGYIRRECSCGEVEIEKMPALGHSYKSVVTNPTCTEDGYTTHACLICGDSYIDSYVSALGHNYDSIVTNSTCTAQGYTTHICSKCENSYVDSYVNATGHKWSAWKITEKPTVEKNGEQERKCEFCLLIESKSIDKLPAPIEYIDLNNYQTAISYGGLTNDEIEIIKNLLSEYEKYKRGEVKEIQYNSVNRISYESYCRINSFFSIYFCNWIDKEKIMSVISYGDTGQSYAVLHEDVIDKYTKEKAEIDEFVENALSQMREGTDEYKLKQISDWIRNNFKYKSGNVDAYVSIKSGEANCNSFALLFKAMASRLGVQCDICVGYSGDSPHAWNMVTLSNGDVRFYDISYYDNSGKTKYLNSVKSPWENYILNDYWYLRN